MFGEWPPEGRATRDRADLAVLLDPLIEARRSLAAGLNGWGEEYIRAECERSTLVMNHGAIQRIDYAPEQASDERQRGKGESVPLLEQPKWANTWLIEKFCHWLGSGEPMETNIEDNLQSMGLIFAAIESSRNGWPVEVQEFLACARASVGDA